MRAGLIAALAATLCSAAHGPALAQFGGGKPKVPTERVLGSYSFVVTNEKLDLPPVSAGLVPGASYSSADMEAMGVDPANYKNTLANMQAIVNAIAKRGPRPDIVPRVKLDMSDRPNAYARSQEEIVVTTGLLDAMDKQVGKADLNSSLWYVLAHEYAHVLFDHPRRFAKKNEDSEFAKYVAALVVLTGSLQPMMRDISPELAAGNKVLVGKMTTATIVSALLERELYRVTVAPYRKEEESLADFMAADLLDLFAEADPKPAAQTASPPVAVAGTAPTASGDDMMAQMMQLQQTYKVQFFDAKAGAESLAVYTNYDNSVVGQLKAGVGHLKGEMKIVKGQILSFAQSSLNSGNFASLPKKMEKSFIQAGLRFLAGIFTRRISKDLHLHYSSDKRIVSIKSYVGQFEGGNVRAAPLELQDAFARKIGTPTAEEFSREFKEEFQYDRAANEAQQALARGDVAAARAAMDKVVTKSKAPTARFHVTDALVWQAQGELEKAETAYKRALPLRDASYSVYSDLAALQVLLGKFDDAGKTLDLAQARFGVERVMVTRIGLLVAQDKLPAAEALAKECAAYPAIAEQCQRMIVVPENTDGESADETEDEEDS